MFSTNHLQNDNELLLLLQQSSEKAFTTPYEGYHKLLYVVALKYLKSSSATEDAVQQEQRMKPMK